MPAKQILTADTTLLPVPVVLVTCSHQGLENVFTLNRIASCNAEPPMLSISVRPGRASHDLIDGSGAFVVNLPWPDMGVVTDFVGTTSLRGTDKWRETGLTPVAARQVPAPLLMECPVNIECRVRHRLRLPSHSLFIAEVLVIHAATHVLDERGEVDFHRLQGGIAYAAGPVREKPVTRFRPEALLEAVHVWRRSQGREKS